MHNSGLLFQGDFDRVFHLQNHWLVGSYKVISLPKVKSTIVLVGHQDPISVSLLLIFIMLSYQNRCPYCPVLAEWDNRECSPYMCRSYVQWLSYPWSRVSQTINGLLIINWGHLWARICRKRFFSKCVQLPCDSAWVAIRKKVQWLHNVSEEACGSLFTIMV